MFLILCRFNRSAPISVPREPAMYAIGAADSPPRSNAELTATNGGMKAGRDIPTPGTTLAIALVASVTMVVDINAGTRGVFPEVKRYRQRVDDRSLRWLQ